MISAAFLIYNYKKLKIKGIDANHCLSNSNHIIMTITLIVHKIFLLQKDAEFMLQKRLLISDAAEFFSYFHIEHSSRRIKFIKMLYRIKDINRPHDTMHQSFDGQHIYKTIAASVVASHYDFSLQID